MSKRKKAYQNYLKSTNWKSLREKAFKRDGYKCCNCGSTSNLNGHHVHYCKDWYNTPLSYIQTLCETCHEEHHRKKSAMRKQRRKENKTFCKLTWLIGNFTAIT